MRSAWTTFLALPSLLAQSSGDWPMYNRDLAGTRYSPLTQISTKNVANLKQAWSPLQIEIPERRRQEADRDRRIL